MLRFLLCSIVIIFFGGTPTESFILLFVFVLSLLVAII